MIWFILQANHYHTGHYISSIFLNTLSSISDICLKIKTGIRIKMQHLKVFTG